MKIQMRLCSISIVCATLIVLLCACHSSAQDSTGPTFKSTLKRAKVLITDKDYRGAAAVLAAVVPEGDQAVRPEWPLFEADFWRLTRVWTQLVKVEALPKDSLSSVFLAQLNGLRRSISEAANSESRAQRYDQWRGLRLRYLQETVLRKKQWKVADSFTAQGVAQQLLAVDAARERFSTCAEQATTSLYEDVLRERENRYWINSIKDRLDPPAERQRLEQILDLGEPADREKEASLIRELFNEGSAGRPVKQQHEQLFDNATAELTTEFALATTPTELERASEDAVKLVSLADQLYRLPPDEIPPQLTMALAFKDRISDPLNRLAMDSAYAIALARRGNHADADRLQQSVERQAAPVGQIAVKKWQRRLDQVHRSLEKIAAGTAMPAPEVSMFASQVANASPTTAPSDRELVSRKELYAQVVLAITKETAITSTDPRRSTRAIEAAMSVYPKLRKPRLARAVLEELENGVGMNAPSYKRAQLKRMRMWVLSWEGKPKEAVQIADGMAQDYLKSSDPKTVDICADALCHAYLYASYYLQDPAKGSKYLEVLIQTFPDGRYTSLMHHFERSLNRLQTNFPLTNSPSR